MGPKSVPPKSVPFINTIGWTTPYVDPSKGVEQFFDPAGPGPTPTDIKNYNAGMATQKVGGNPAFPSLEKEFVAVNTIGGKFKSLIGKTFNPVVRGIKDVFNTSKIIAVFISIFAIVFLFFALKFYLRRG